jgi:hypothetical protein
MSFPIRLTRAHNRRRPELIRPDLACALDLIELDLALLPERLHLVKLGAGCFRLLR